MKTLIILICLFLFASGGSLINAQEVKKNNTDNREFSPKVKAASLKADEENPAKPLPFEADPKMAPADLPTEKDYGKSNAKPSATLTSDKKVRKIRNKETLQTKKDKMTLEPDPALLPRETNDQPAGGTRESHTDYKNMKGPNTQPEGGKEAPVQSYKNMKGPNTQPEVKNLKNEVRKRI